MAASEAVLTRDHRSRDFNQTFCQPDFRAYGARELYCIISYASRSQTNREKPLAIRSEQDQLDRSLLADFLRRCEHAIRKGKRGPHR